MAGEDFLIRLSVVFKKFGLIKRSHRYHKFA